MGTKNHHVHSLYKNVNLFMYFQRTCHVIRFPVLHPNGIIKYTLQQFLKYQFVDIYIKNSNGLLINIGSFGKLSTTAEQFIIHLSYIVVLHVRSASSFSHEQYKVFFESSDRKRLWPNVLSFVYTF